VEGAFVLDNSVVMRWCFDDGDVDYADAVLDRLGSAEAIVPGLWALEVANGLAVAERRKLLTPARSARFLELVGGLRIRVVHESAPRVLGEVLALARSHQLSAYDAAYLDLAMREGVPLATLDGPVREAAKRCRVPILRP
jgi:predicted nucleic acid-binding protein